MQSDASTAISAPTDSSVTEAAGVGLVEILNISVGVVIRTGRAGPANVSP